MKKKIEVVSNEIELGSYTTNFGKLMEKLREIEKEFPYDARLRGHVSGYDDEYYTIYFTHQREETDFEYQNRLNKEYYEKKRIEDDELEMYRRLKNKFGDK